MTEIIIYVYNFLSFCVGSFHYLHLHFEGKLNLIKIPVEILYLSSWLDIHSIVVWCLDWVIQIIVTQFGKMWLNFMFVRNKYIFNVAINQIKISLFIPYGFAILFALILFNKPALKTPIYQKSLLNTFTNSWYAAHTLDICAEPPCKW